MLGAQLRTSSGRLGGKRGHREFSHGVLVRAVPFQHKADTPFFFGLTLYPDGQEQPLLLTLCKLIPSVK